MAIPEVPSQFNPTMEIALHTNGGQAAFVTLARNDRIANGIAKNAAILPPFEEKTGTRRDDYAKWEVLKLNLKMGGESITLIG